MLSPVFLTDYNLLVLLMTSLSNCVIVTSFYMHILYFLKRSDSFTFLSDLRGVGVYLVYGSSLPPTWPLVFFSDE